MCPVDLGGQRVTELHVLYQGRALALRGHEDASLVGYGTRFQQIPGDSSTLAASVQMTPSFQRRAPLS
jgi:hypothetical protein